MATNLLEICLIDKAGRNARYEELLTINRTEVNPTNTAHALELLYERHQKELLRHLYRIVLCEHTAEDLAQETFLRIAGIELEQRLEQPRAFLYRIATNLALDHLRRQKVRAPADVPGDIDESLIADHPSVENTVFDKQRFELFMRALDSLPPRCRQVFMLHRLDHLSYRDIAERLDISQSAVEKHIIRALSRCHAMLSKYGADSW